MCANSQLICLDCLCALVAHLMCARTLFTPTIAGVTKIAHRERVPNGALPKFWEGPHSLIGKDNTVVQEEKTSLRMCIFVPSTVMSSWEHVAAVSCSGLTDTILQRVIGQARYYRSLVLLDKIINQVIVRTVGSHRSFVTRLNIEITLCVLRDSWYPPMEQ